MFSQIDQKKALLDAKRPLPKYTLKSLEEKLLLEWTYNSNAIEGNTLTMQETKVVLEGITVGGKTMREHLEVINHRDAIGFVEEIVRKEDPLSQWQIKNLHGSETPSTVISISQNGSSTACSSPRIKYGTKNKSNPTPTINPIHFFIPHCMSDSSLPSQANTVTN